MTGRELIGRVLRRRIGEPAQSFVHERRSADGARGHCTSCTDAICREVVASERHRNDEGRTFPKLALGADGSAMQLDQFVNESEADATAFVRPAANVFDAMETLEHARQFLLGNADAGIANAQFDVIADLVQRNRDRTFEGELESVRNQIEDNLLPHGAVDEHRVGEGRAVQLKLQPSLFGRGTKHAGELDRKRGKVGGLIGGLHPARLDARKIEQRIHQAQEASSIPIDEFELTLGGRRKIGVTSSQKFLHGTKHEREGRAEFVADVAEECSLGAIEFCESIQTPSFFFGGACILDGSGDLVYKQVKEGHVFRIQPAGGIHASD